MTGVISLSKSSLNTMEYSIIFVLSILFINNAVGELPSYIPVCGRWNPKLDECVTNSIEALRSKLVTGIPQLNVPTIEPLSFGMPLSLTNLNNVKVVFSNVKIYNSSTFQTRKVHLDIKNQSIDALFHFDKLKLLGDYDIAAKIIFDIQGTGSAQIDPVDVDVQCFIGYTLRKSKKGPKMYFTSMTTKIKMRDYESHITPTHQGSDRKVLDDSIDMVLKNNRREIIDSIMPSFEKAFSTTILDIGNRITATATYDELLPDHE